MENSKNKIMLLENNFASIAHDINCHDDKSFLSRETRQKAAYFFHEDQVSVVQGLNYMTYHGLRNIFMNTWYARTTNLCINSWDSLWIDFETNGQLHRIPQNHGLVWRPRAADSRQWLIPVGVEPCHASPGEYLHRRHVTYEVCKIFGILTPQLVCIHATSHTTSAYRVPPFPLPLQRSYVHAPIRN